ncbi:MAG: hypothetical protein R2755_28340 [Acidimicrobiales bacterium]
MLVPALDRFSARLDPRCVSVAPGSVGSASLSYLVWMMVVMAEVLVLDPVALVDVGAEALESALVSWSSTMAASEFRWLRLVAEYDRRRLFERWECQTCAQWLMWHCSLDLRRP